MAFSRASVAVLSQLLLARAFDQAIVSSFAPYPGYAGDLAVEGVMSIISTNDTQTLSWMLSGVDPRCNETCTATNCCGVHIHVGKTCSTAADIGGHYWTTGGTDPWLTVMYNSTNMPSLETDLAVVTGASGEDVSGRAMVIHDFEGGRVACGLIANASVGGFDPYPGYDGNLATAGVMQVYSKDVTQSLTWIFTAGLDTRCSAACTAANCCGIHIHVGTNCSDAGTIGGHYWNSTFVAADPWAMIMYNTSHMPSVMSDVMVSTGYMEDNIEGHTMVIHDFDGGRIACSPITDVLEGMWTDSTTTTTSGASGSSDISFAHTGKVGVAFGALVSSLAVA